MSLFSEKFEYREQKTNERTKTYEDFTKTSGCFRIFCNSSNYKTLLDSWKMQFDNSAGNKGLLIANNFW